MHVILSESVICFNDSYTSLTNTIVCILHIFSIERFTKVLKGTPIFIFKTESVSGYINFDYAKRWIQSLV